MSQVLKNVHNIVILPAFMCSADLFKYQINILQKHGNIIIPVLKDFNNITDAAKYVLSLVSEDFYLIGISMGGYIAMEMLVLERERIKKLCLMATKIELDSEEQKKQRLNGIKAVQTSQNVKATKSYLSSMLYNNINNQDVYTVIQNMNDKLGVDAYINQQHMILSRNDLRGKLTNCYSPTLVIAGENDVVTPPKMLEDISKEIPNSKLVSIKNCGHLIPLDQPVTLGNLLESFIID